MRTTGKSLSRPASSSSNSYSCDSTWPSRELRACTGPTVNARRKAIESVRMPGIRKRRPGVLILSVTGSHGTSTAPPIKRVPDISAAILERRLRRRRAIKRQNTCACRFAPHNLQLIYRLSASLRTDIGNSPRVA